MASLVSKYKKFFPSSTKSLIKELVLRSRTHLDSRKRAMPNFILIGAQRSGSTSMYSYLMEHPQIIPNFQKQCFFFDRNFSKGLKYYKANFPLLSKIEKKERESGLKCLVGEATPDYVFNPLCAKRIDAIVPSAKLIFQRRNQLERSISEYTYAKNYFQEESDINLYFEKELQEATTIMNLNLSYEKIYEHYSSFPILIKGLYNKQIAHWKTQSNNPILEIASEDFFRNSDEVYNSILKFLELEKFSLVSYEKKNSSNSIHKQTLSSIISDDIVRFFAKYDC